MQDQRPTRINGRDVVITDNFTQTAKALKVSPSDRREMINAISFNPKAGKVVARHKGSKHMVLAWRGSLQVQYIIDPSERIFLIAVVSHDGGHDSRWKKVFEAIATRLAGEALWEAASEVFDQIVNAVLVRFGMRAGGRVTHYKKRVESGAYAINTEEHLNRVSLSNLLLLSAIIAACYSGGLLVKRIDRFYPRIIFSELSLPWSLAFAKLSGPPKARCEVFRKARVSSRTRFSRPAVRNFLISDVPTHGSFEDIFSLAKKYDNSARIFLAGGNSDMNHVSNIAVSDFDDLNWVFDGLEIDMSDRDWISADHVSKYLHASLAKDGALDAIALDFDSINRAFDAVGLVTSDLDFDHSNLVMKHLQACLSEDGASPSGWRLNKELSVRQRRAKSKVIYCGICD